MYWHKKRNTSILSWKEMIEVIPILNIPLTVIKKPLIT